MARAILEIPVNDKAFKEFMVLFDKYQEELKKLPEEWKDVNNIVLANTAATSVQTEMLMEHATLLQKQTKELEKQEKIKDKAERRAEKERSDKEKADKKAIADTKKIVDNITKATVQVIKWGALDFLIGGAADLWGLGTLAKTVGTNLSAARGVNATIGQRQALALTFQPLFDATSALERAATAQTDITQSIPYRILGINPNAGSTADVSVQAALAAKRRLQGVPQQDQLLMAHALGLDQIFSPDELRRIINTPIEFIDSLDKARKKYEKQLEVSPQVAQEYSLLAITLQAQGQRIETFFANKLIALGPTLDTMIEGFGNLAINFLEKIDWKNLAVDFQMMVTNVENFVKNIPWDRIVTDVIAFGLGVERFMRAVHWIPEEKYAPGSPEDLQQKADDAKLNALIAGLGIALGPATGGISANLLSNPALNNMSNDIVGAISDASEMDRAKDTYMIARKFGSNSFQAAAIAAWGDTESGNQPMVPLKWDPVRKQWNNDNDAAYGTFQMHGSTPKYSNVAGSWENLYEQAFPGHTIRGDHDKARQIYVLEKMIQRDPHMKADLQTWNTSHDPAALAAILRTDIGRGDSPQAQAREVAGVARNLYPYLIKVESTITGQPGNDVATSARLAGQ